MNTMLRFWKALRGKAQKAVWHSLIPHGYRQVLQPSCRSDCYAKHMHLQMAHSQGKEGEPKPFVLSSSKLKEVLETELPGPLCSSCRYFQEEFSHSVLGNFPSHHGYGTEMMPGVPSAGPIWCSSKWKI